jgi:outer membrane immunogenic protein
LLACLLLCGFAGSAAAADMAVLGPYQPPPVAPLYSWTSCYIGFNMGGGAAPMSRTDTTGVFAPAGASLGDLTARGVVGGGQLGCDYQIGSWVFGLQGLVDLSGMKGSDVLPNAILVNNSYIQTVATITGRIGYTVLPTLLLYGKAGGAYTHSLYDIGVIQDVPFLVGTMTPTSSANGPIVPCGGGFGPCQIALGSKSVGGWTVGFGGEWAFAHAPVSVFLEYDYLGMRSADVSLTSAIVPALVFPINVSQKVHTVLFGVNLRFGGGTGY